MSNPVSLPTPQVQPNEAYYGTEFLTLFNTYTRDSYLAAFGVSAPPYDPTRVIKTWFDSTADTSNPSNVSLYKVLGQPTPGNYALQQLVMPSIEAGIVNLPGAITYPVYTPAPTKATRGGSGINATYMSLLSDAQTLMAQLGGSSISDEGASPVFPVIYPADEPRRVWDFIFKNAPVNVGLLIADRNIDGIGAPGHWDTTGDDPAWVPDPPAPTGLDDTRPPRPMPMRDLLPNEQFKAGLMGVGISRTDLQQTVNQANGEFSADDRATLQKIYQLLNNLVA